MFWALAAVALVAFGGALLLESSFVEERGRRLLEERLSAALERNVQIGGLGFEALPLSLELRDVEVAGLAGRPPFVEVERLLVEGRSFSWGRRELNLGRVLAEGPVVRIGFYDDGTRSLPLQGRQKTGQAGRSGFDLSVGEFTIRDGAVEVDQERLPLSVAGRGLRANFLGGAGLELAGRVDADDVELLLPGGRPYLGTLALRLELGAEGLQIVHGRLTGPQLEARVGGGWTWRPERGLDLEIDAQGDAALFEQLGYLSGQLAGPFRFDGELSWRPQLWGYRGSLESDRLQVFGRDLSDLRGAIAGDRNGVHVDVSRANYGGGRVNGRVAFRHGEEERPFDLDLVLSDVALSRVLEDQSIPLSGIEGRVSGPFSYTFPIRDPTRGSGGGRLEIVAAEAVGGDLQVTGVAPITLARGVLRCEAIQARSELQQILVDGVFDLTTQEGTFELQGTSRQVAELMPLLPLAPETLETQIWVPTAGVGELGATLLVAPNGTRSEVRLDLVDFRSPGGDADRLRGNFTVVESGLRDLRLELSRPSGALVVSGSIPFDGGAVSDLDPPFDLGIQAAGWPLDDGRAWLPFELPADGPVHGSIRLWGDPESLSGSVSGFVQAARLGEVDVDSIEVELEFDSERVRFDRVEVHSGAGSVRVAGDFGVVSGRLDLELESGDLDLAQAPFVERLSGLTGSFAVLGRIGGTLETPSVDGEVTWSGLEFEGLHLSTPSRTQIVWRDDRLELDGSLPGLPAISGGGRLDDQGYDVALSVQVEDLSRALAAALGNPPQAVGGALEGVATLRGEFGGGFAPVLELALDRLELSRDGVRLEEVEPVSMRYADGRLDIESLFLETPDQANELFVAGTVEFRGEGLLELTAQSSLESEWLELLLSDVDMLAGRFDVLASIGGSLKQPRFNGVGRLSDARLLVGALSMSVESLEGLALFYPERIVFDSVRARAGGGDVQAGGSIVLQGADEPSGYEFNAVGTGLSLPVPEGWLIRGDARVSLVSTQAGRTLRGEADLDRAYYFEPIKLGFESALQALFQRRRAFVEETSEVLATTALNLTIRGEDALRVRNNIGNLGGSVDFDLRGSLADPVLFGSVRLTPGGTLVYAGNEYEIDRGELNFANPYRIDPIIDLVATTDLRDYDVRLNLSGSPERLEVGVTSDPPLPELEVLALLTGGRAPTRFGLDPDRSGGEALGVEGFLAGEAAAVVTDRVNRLFGLDQLRVSPLTGSSGDLSSARVTLGERISRDLFATYSYDPSTSEEQILELEWSVSPSLQVVFTQNGDSSYSLDLRWEKAF